MRSGNNTVGIVGETGLGVDARAPNDPEPVGRADPAQPQWMKWVAKCQVLGTYSCGVPGPLVLAMGGCHDNETGSPRAINAFLRLLESRRPAIRGTFIGMIGTFPADAHHQSRLRTLRNRCAAHDVSSPEITAETDVLDARSTNLNELLFGAIQKHAEIIIIDFHTTPMLTIPYLSILPLPRTAALARKFPVNIVAGLQQDVPGFRDCNDANVRRLTFVAGQHQSAAAFNNQIAMLWLMLIHCKAMQHNEPENTQDYADMLAADSPTERHCYRVLRHYSTADREGFDMEPGLENFDFVKKHSRMATDRHGAILAPTDGYLLLPLNEERRKTGFFLVGKEDVARTLARQYQV